MGERRMQAIATSVSVDHPKIKEQDLLFTILQYWLNPDKNGRFCVVTEKACLLKWDINDVVIIYGKDPKMLHLTGDLVRSMVRDMNGNESDHLVSILSQHTPDIDYILGHLPWPCMKVFKEK